MIVSSTCAPHKIIDDVVLAFVFVVGFLGINYRHTTGCDVTILKLLPTETLFVQSPVDPRKLHTEELLVHWSRQD